MMRSKYSDYWALNICSEYSYSSNTSNYTKRITLSDLTHVMSMADPVAIGVDTKGYWVLFGERVH